MAIVGFGGTATSYAQDSGVTFEASYGTTAAAPGVKLCNNGVVKQGNNYYLSTALHCETGTTGRAAVNRDDVTYRKVPVSYVRQSVAKVLDYGYFPEWSLDHKTITAHMKVYNIQGETGRNRYSFEITGTAHFDSELKMYFIRISQEILREYTEKVGNFPMYRMKSSSGSPVEYHGKEMGTVSGTMYNPSNRKCPKTGLEANEARIYIAPAKEKLTT